MSAGNESAAGPGGDGGARAKQDGQHPNSTPAQCERLLDALRKGPISTLDARRDLDIVHPGGRAKDLRDSGHVITTAWSREPTDCGRLHRVARYVLLAEAQPAKGGRHGR